MPPEVLVLCHKKLVETMIKEAHFPHKDQREHLTRYFDISPTSLGTFDVKWFPLERILAFDFLLVLPFDVVIYLLLGPL